ncbi:hypothetical protein QQ045_000848 [Rhodiola kirilowii]
MAWIRPKIKLNGHKLSCKLKPLLATASDTEPLRTTVPYYKAQFFFVGIWIVGCISSLETLRVDEAIGFMGAAGLTLDHPLMNSVEFRTSHECLHLPYEQALTREDSTTGLYYGCSAHMLTNVSDKMDPKELVKLCEILNPHNEPGRLTIITRMGADNMRIKLPHLIRAFRQAGLLVTWVSDPTHGNTIRAPCGLKTETTLYLRVGCRSDRC